MELSRSASTRPELGAAHRVDYLTLLSLGALFLAVFAWLPAFGAPYQFDDYNTPVGDAASQSLSSFWQAFPNTLRPLTKLTYALESSLGAGSAPLRRVLNALLFGGCAALLKGLLDVAGVRAPIALLVACVWAVHPVHAETLVALAGRPVLLSLFLMLASALLLLRGRPGLALLGALLALLARESALPWVIACAALAARERGWSRQRLVAAGAVAFGGGALLLVGSSSVRRLLSSALGASGASDHLGLQWAALTRGTLMLIESPLGFTPDIDFTPSGGVRALLIFTTLGAYGGALWLALRRTSSREVRVFALLWLCVVVPTHSLVPKLDVLTARPFSASLAPLLALGACWLTPKLSDQPRRRAFVGLALVATVALLFPLTRYRAELYRDPIALWRDTAERTTHSVRPLVNLGSLLARDGQLAEAQAVLLRALARDPNRYDTRMRLHAVQRALRPSH